MRSSNAEPQVEKVTKSIFRIIQNSTDSVFGGIAGTSRSHSFMPHPTKGAYRGLQL